MFEGFPSIYWSEKISRFCNYIGLLRDGVVWLLIRYFYILNIQFSFDNTTIAFFHPHSLILHLNISKFVLKKVS